MLQSTEWVNVDVRLCCVLVLQSTEWANLDVCLCAESFGTLGAWRLYSYWELSVHCVAFMVGTRSLQCGGPGVGCRGGALLLASGRAARLSCLHLRVRRGVLPHAQWRARGASSGTSACVASPGRPRLASARRGFSSTIGAAAGGAARGPAPSLFGPAAAACRHPRGNDKGRNKSGGMSSSNISGGAAAYGAQGPRSLAFHMASQASIDRPYDTS